LWLGFFSVPSFRTVSEAGGIWFFVLNVTETRRTCVCSPKLPIGLAFKTLR